MSEWNSFQGSALPIGAVVGGMINDPAYVRADGGLYNIDAMPRAAAAFGTTPLTFNDYTIPADNGSAKGSLDFINNTLILSETGTPKNINAAAATLTFRYTTDGVTWRSSQIVAAALANSFAFVVAPPVWNGTMWAVLVGKLFAGGGSQQTLLDLYTSLDLSNWALQTNGNLTVSANNNDASYSTCWLAPYVGGFVFTFISSAGGIWIKQWATGNVGTMLVNNDPGNYGANLPYCLVHGGFVHWQKDINNMLKVPLGGGAIVSKAVTLTANTTCQQGTVLMNDGSLYLPYNGLSITAAGVPNAVAALPSLQMPKRGVIANDRIQLVRPLTPNQVWSDGNYVYWPIQSLYAGQPPATIARVSMADYSYSLHPQLLRGSPETPLYPAGAFGGRIIFVPPVGNVPLCRPTMVDMNGTPSELAYVGATLASASAIVSWAPHFGNAAQPGYYPALGGLYMLGTGSQVLKATGDYNPATQLRVPYIPSGHNAQAYQARYQPELPYIKVR